MKRAQRWSLASEEGPGHRVSPSGPFRRRRALREVDSLAQHPAREPSPDAVAHVRVIGDEDGMPVGLSNPSSIPARPIGEGKARETDTGPVGTEPMNASDRLYAVPIEQPLGVELEAAIPER